jgi:hypothetical protein
LKHIRLDRHAEGSFRAGFTIVEVVFAMGILALGASVLLGLLNFGASLASGAKVRAEAASMLPTVVIDLEERLFPLLEDGSVGEPVDVVDQPVPGHSRLTYSTRSTPVSDEEAGGMPTLYRVEIELAWMGQGRRRALTCDTLMTRQVPFGARLRRAFIENETIDNPLVGGNP